MNSIVKISVAGALAVGGLSVANASISAPSSGSSDLILFAEVLNSSNTVVASFAGDTGISVATAAAGLTGSTTLFAGNSNLQKLINADATGDTLYWAVEGGAWTGSNTNANFNAPGNAKFITTVVGDNASGDIGPLTTGNLEQWIGLSGTVSSLNTNLAGASTVEASTAAGGGIWDENTPSGISGWFSNGPVTGNSSIGTANHLYYVTGAGNKPAGTDPVTYVSIGTGTFNAANDSFVLAGASSAVPLPPAVWLLGSGLLGLAGIARRKAKA